MSYTLDDFILSETMVGVSPFNTRSFRVGQDSIYNRYVNAVLASKPKLYVPFGEPVGQKPVDLANGYSGFTAYQGAVAQNFNGPFPGAKSTYFAPVSAGGGASPVPPVGRGMIACPGFTMSNTNGICFEFWNYVERAHFLAFGTFGPFGNGAFANKSYAAIVPFSNYMVYFSYGSSSIGGTTSYDPYFDNWTHICMMAEPSSGPRSIYINGKLATYSSVTYTQPDWSDWVINPPTLYFGIAYASFENSSMMSNFAIYERPLTSTEVADHYFCAKNISTLKTRTFSLPAYTPNSPKLAQLFTTNGTYTPTKASVFLKPVYNTLSTYFDLTNEVSINALNFSEIENGIGSYFIPNDIDKNLSVGTKGYLLLKTPTTTTTYPVINYPVKASVVGTHYIFIKGQGFSGQFAVDIFIDDVLAATINNYSLSGTDWYWNTVSISINTTEIINIRIQPKCDNLTINKIVINKTNTSPTGDGPTLTTAPYVTIHGILYTTNLDDTPNTLLPCYDYKTSAEVKQNDWYNFDLKSKDTAQTFTDNKYAFVLFTSGSDNNKYILWETSYNNDNSDASVIKY